MVRDLIVGEVDSNLSEQRVELNPNVLKLWWITLTARLWGARGKISLGFLLDFPRGLCGKA